MRGFISILLLLVSINAFCQKISKKDFKKQLIDSALINKKWVLEEISTDTFSKSREQVSQQPSVYLTFSEQGILQLSFAGFERLFKGHFLQKGNDFLYFHSGIDERVLWTDQGATNEINPNTIAYKLNYGVSSYKIEGRELRLVLTKNKGYFLFKKE
jgi:hypothetical protein